MDKINRAMDEQLQKRVADLTAHNDETGDGKLDAADLKAQLNRIEAQLELQDRQNRNIMRNQRLRMMLSIAITVVLLVALGGFWYYSRIAYHQVMDSTATSLSMDNKIPVLLFALKDPENILRAIMGEKIGTIVQG